MGIKMIRTMRSWLRSLNLWCFDRLIFDADQHIPYAAETLQDQLKTLLDDDLPNPSDCYQLLSEFDSDLTDELDRDLSKCYLLPAATVDTLFQLGWHHNIYLFVSIPFVSLASVPSIDVTDKLTELAKLRCNHYKTRYLRSRLLTLESTHNVVNYGFYHLIIRLANDIDNEVDSDSDVGDSIDVDNADGDNGGADSNDNADSNSGTVYTYASADYQMQ